MRSEPPDTTRPVVRFTTLSGRKIKLPQDKAKWNKKGNITTIETTMIDIFGTPNRRE